MFDIYKKYHPKEIKDSIGWNDGVEIDDLSTALMVLCDIIDEQRRRIERLEKLEKARDEAAQDLIAHLNGMKPDY